MKARTAQSLFAASFLSLAMGLASQAHALHLTPADMDFVGSYGGNEEKDNICSLFGLTIEECGLLTLYYKSNVDGGSEEGTFAGSYETSYFNDPGDPQDADVIYVEGEQPIGCPECFLAVKDGNPKDSEGNTVDNYYFYDLGDWDGMETIELRGFWPNQGAISHVSIWGFEGGGDDDEQPVSEPGILFLMGAGLLGLGMARRRKAA